MNDVEPGPAVDADITEEGVARRSEFIGLDEVEVLLEEGMERFEVVAHGQVGGARRRGR